MVEDYALFPSSDAQVAELVDALASGASDRKVVEVRVFSWAPNLPIMARPQGGAFFGGPDFGAPKKHFP
jgi:hypothetical protein